MTPFRVACLGLFGVLPLAQAQPLALHWLDSAPHDYETGVSFGVPWPEGAVRPDSGFVLAHGGDAMPVQTWTLAYWPDGSVKWTGVSTIAPAGLSGDVTLQPGAATVSGKLRVDRTETAVSVDTGAIQCAVPLGGGVLISSIRANGHVVAASGRLVCLLQHGPSGEDSGAADPEAFFGTIKKVTVEQSGPVRAVIRCEGLHRSERSGREWLPFTVRLYFYSGQSAVRLVHSIVFDGDQEKDFVRGLGVEFSVPYREEARYRQVRFGGQEGGLWSEPLQPGGGNAAQEAGQDFAPRGNFSDNAIWDDFKLVQPNPHGFTVVKRTNPKSTWLFSAAGTRAGGYVFTGDRKGGLGMSIRNFWQSFPSSLEVRHASQSSARLVAWLWSPDGPPMDMRHYDIKAHTLSASYEDVQPGLSTAFGVGRTSELMLFPSADLPSRTEAVVQTAQGQTLPLLACTPQYIHSTGVLGVWSLPDRSTPFKKSIEDGLDSVLGYYQRQVDERDWYGFWQFGDFMHSYSIPRHVWHYDWGGHAWDNTELGAPLWLWYSYLRSGRADLFRLAEAYTRNTSETDVYHIGPMAGLGSRHNVIKWGDGAKEARISQSAHWRMFYYLTTDERTGDIMQETLRADLSVARFDPMREAEPPVPGEPTYAARLRVGPDWFALAGNWMTQWERTGDVRWRDRILAGVESLVAMPYGLRSGQLNGLNPDLPDGKIGPLKGGGSMTVAYDPETGKLTAIRDPLTKTSVPVNYNLATIQGGAEVMFELVPLLGRSDFAKAWLQYCRLGGAPAGVLDRDRTTGNEGADARYVERGQSGPRLAAYSYAQTHDAAYADRALKDILGQEAGWAAPHWVTGADAIKPVEEAPRVSTNVAAQTGLQTIEFLEFCHDHLPTEAVDFAHRPVPAYRYGEDGPPGGRKKS